MKIVELKKYFYDIELILMNKVIYHTHTTIDNENIRKKLGYLFPSKNLSEKLYQDIMSKYNLHDIDYIFVTASGIGDTFFVAAYLNMLKKESDLRIAILLRDYKCYEMVKTFDIDEIIVDKEFSIRAFHSSDYPQIIKKYSTIKVHFPYVANKIPEYFGEHYKYLIGVKNNNQAPPPINIPQKFLEEATNEFKKLKLNPDKTIILSPEAVYFNYKALDEEFWLQMANKLTLMGYQVLFNTKNPIYKKYNCFFPQEIMLCVAMVRKAKHLISFRSGLNDICAGFGVSNQISIYPKNFELNKDNCFEKFRAYHKKILNEGGKLFDYYSLEKHFGLPQHEFILNNSSDKLALNIINVIKKAGV